MKKRIALALILAMIPMLCAYKVPAAAEKEVRVEIPVIPEEYLKYQELLDTLEAGNFDEARNMVEQMRPAPEYPPVTSMTVSPRFRRNLIESAIACQLSEMICTFFAATPRPASSTLAMAKPEAKTETSPIRAALIS